MLNLTFRNEKVGILEIINKEIINAQIVIKKGYSDNFKL